MDGRAIETFVTVTQLAQQRGVRNAEARARDDEEDEEERLSLKPGSSATATVEN